MPGFIRCQELNPGICACGPLPTGLQPQPKEVLSVSLSCCGFELLIGQPLLPAVPLSPQSGNERAFWMQVQGISRPTDECVLWLFLFFVCSFLCFELLYIPGWPLNPWPSSFYLRSAGVCYHTLSSIYVFKGLSLHSNISVLIYKMEIKMLTQ